MTREEYDEWYKGVGFIQKEMQFYSYADFVREAFMIKYLYSRLEQRTKKLYQWYVFANHISYNQKCVIWNFLNGYGEYEDLLYYISLRDLANM